MYNADGKPLRVALVHDWLTGMRGGEKVLAQMCKLAGGADIFTLVHVPGSTCEIIESRRIITSILNKLPGIGKYYRMCLPLMPMAIGQMSVAGYDLVISSSHCVAKGISGSGSGSGAGAGSGSSSGSGIKRSSESLHVCYCHTPMRYLWAVGKDYDQSMGLMGLGLRLLRPALRSWDVRSAGNVDHFIANSNCIAERITSAYNRTSDVLFPPADVDFYCPAQKTREDFYLIVSALAPYKRVDQALAACKKLRRPLKIIGTGQLASELKKSADGDIEFLGWQDDEVVREHYRQCKALLFPTLEDFGIVPIEAQSCGAPVIAFGKGGALDTVSDDDENPTGLLYPSQTVESLIQAIEKFEQLPPARFDPHHMHQRAKGFSEQAFRDGFIEILRPLFEQKGWSLE